VANLTGDVNPGAAVRFAGQGIPTLLPLEGSGLRDRPVGVPARAVREARLDALQARTSR
jgi:hypothetical protein